jgi:HSP20 family protein
MSSQQQSQQQRQVQSQRQQQGSSQQQQQQRGMNRWNNNRGYNRRSLFDEIFDSPIERVIKSYFGNNDNDDIWNDNMSLMRPFGNNNNNQLMQSSFKSDLVELDKEYQVHADLPGMNKKDINITFKDGQLEIEGKRENKRDEWDQNHSVHTQEVSYGQFYRTWYLPKSQHMNVKNIKANYDNGVLLVHVPKDQPDSQQITQNKVNID